MASVLLGVVEEVKYKETVKYIRSSSCQGGSVWQLNIVRPGQSCPPSGDICKGAASVDCLFYPFLQSLEFDFY